MRENLAVCDVINLPYMNINWQSISIYYGYFVTSLTAYYSCENINPPENSYSCITCYSDSYPPENSPPETRPNWKWSSLSSFQKLMLIKVLRMDSLMESCSTFVCLTLGDHFIGSQEQSLNNLYRKSKPQYPILFILSPGNYWLLRVLIFR